MTNNSLPNAGQSVGWVASFCNPTLRGKCWVGKAPTQPTRLEPLKALLSIGLKTKRVGTLLNAANKVSLEQFKQKIIVQQKNAPL
jgi:hypothetical protein